MYVPNKRTRKYGKHQIEMQRQKDKTTMRYDYRTIRMVKITKKKKKKALSFEDS